MSRLKKKTKQNNAIAIFYLFFQQTLDRVQAQLHGPAAANPNPRLCVFDFWQ